MAVNSAFKTSGLAASTSEQNLYSDLVKESIQIHGHDVNYIDRTLQEPETIFLAKTLFQNLKSHSLLKCMLKMQKVVIKGKKN